MTANNNNSELFVVAFPDKVTGPFGSKGKAEKYLRDEGYLNFKKDSEEGEWICNKLVARVVPLYFP